MPETLPEVAEHDVIGPDRAAADLEVAASVIPGLTRDRFVLRTDSHPAQLAAARAGMGIAVAQVLIGDADPPPRISCASYRTWSSVAFPSGYSVPDGKATELQVR